MRGAIFDLDGTLADTSRDLLTAANVALALHDLPRLDYARDRVWAGRGGRSMIRRALTLAGRPDTGDEAEAIIKALYPELLAAYGDALVVHTHLFDGVEACLEQLAADGWRLAVCTNKPEGLALGVLGGLGILGRFGAMLGADTLAVHKPHPDHFREAARRAGADPARSIMIGDTDTDLNTARAAGVPCIITRFGFSLDPVESLGADAIVDSYAGMSAALDRLSAA